MKPLLNLLAVDDEPGILRALEDLLEAEFQVFSVGTAEGGLALLRQFEFAVVVSDQRMPGMSGDEFLARAKEISQATRVLLTGYSDIEATTRAVNEGQIYAYVLKPWNALELKTLLARAADHYTLAREAEHERELLRVLMDSLPDHIYFKDNALRYTRVNRAQARLLGIENPAACIGRTEAECYPEMAETGTSGAELFAGAACESGACGKDAVDWEVIERGQPVLNALETLADRSCGQRWFSVSRVPLTARNGEVTGVVGVSRDVSALKHKEEEIQRLNLLLERRVAERTAELTVVNGELEAFSYSVAHGLRAPARHIAGFSKILAEACGSVLTAESKKYLARIEDGAIQMGCLVDDLLNLSKVSRQTLGRRNVALDSLLESVREDLRPEWGDREIEWEIEPLGCSECDAGLIRQVFVNLLSNSVKFTRGRKPGRIAVRQTRINGERTFLVRDNGAGFDMQYVEKLFGVFQRLHRQQDFEGTGIGLATVQRILNKHGGRIWACAEPEKGATFFFTIPAATEAA